MNYIFQIIEYIAFIICAINVIYLLFFSIVSLFSKPQKSNKASKIRKIAILVPAYKEDAVILGCAKSCINQDYPNDKFDTVIISDQMNDSTVAKLKEMPLNVITANFEKSTKSKALNLAMNSITTDFDIAVVLDADNIIAPSYLSDINAAFEDNNVKIVQAHRTAKNINTATAYLDAISEEINNSIFRKAHATIGLSAAIIGSGVAFDYNLFKSTMSKIDAVGGFDKALELTLLLNHYRIYYLNNTYVLDEKVQSQKDFSRQRRRWISAQFHYLCKHSKYFIPQLFKGNFDFCDKLFQQSSIPRLLLLGFIMIAATVISLISIDAALKWWLLMGIFLISMYIAIPRKYYNRHMAMALLKLPRLFFSFSMALFHIKTANKSFIHTNHGIKINS